MYKRNAGLSAKYELFNYKRTVGKIESEVFRKPALRLYSPFSYFFVAYVKNLL